METEYEIKILGITINDITSKINKLNFKEPKRLDFKRYVYEIKGNDSAWLRLRTDSKKTTLTYKNFIKDAVDGVQELEIIVDNFEKTHELLLTLGYEYSAYQENIRTLYENDEIELAIDEWPYIEPYLEIEGKNKEIVERYIKILGLAHHKMTSESTTSVYKMQGLNIKDYINLTF